MSLFLLFIVTGLLVSCRSNDSNSESGDSMHAYKDNPDSVASATNVNADPVIDTSSAPQHNNTSADWLLIPGISAGQTKIDQDADMVYKRLGKPDGGDAAMQKAVAIWYSNHDSTAHSVAIYTARSTDRAAIARILQIRITSPSFITKDGIHTTSSLADIESKFTTKQTETYEDAGAKYKVYDSKEGIAFEINSSSKCVAIIIHKTGVTGEETYLKFRTTNKFIDRRN